MNGPMLLVFVTILVVTWLPEIAQCQDENEETIDICAPASRAEGWESCLTLQQYINNSTSHNLSSEAILFRLLPGRHTLNGTERLVVSNTNFTMVSVNEGTILDCRGGSDTIQHNIVFLSIGNGSVQFNSVNIIGCRFYFSDIYDITINGGYFYGARDREPAVVYPAAVTVVRAMSVYVRKWNCSNYEGGCLNLTDTTLHLSSSNFTNNLNTIITTLRADLNIDMCFFDSNRGELGGVINAHSAHIGITCSTFTNNVATGSGGVFFTNESSLFLTSSIFESNSAGQHGGVFLLKSTSIGMVSSTISNNVALLSGGAGRIMHGSISFRETNFQSNSAANRSNFVTLCFANVNPQDEIHLLRGPQDSDNCEPYDGNITDYQNCCPNACKSGILSVVIGVITACVVLLLTITVIIIVLLICYKRIRRAGRRCDQTSDQKDLQGAAFQNRSERIYDSIPDIVWYPPAPLQITRIDRDLRDADKIQTKPNKVYGMQIINDNELSELSYCEAYQQQQKEKISHSQEDQEEMSYCNAYIKNKSFVGTI